MAGKTKIQWAGSVWNPTTGCDKVSPGCRHCYAGTVAETRLKDHPYYKDGFFGNVQVHPEKLDVPRRVQPPETFFVNSMSDLFHPAISDDFIYRVWQVMEDCERHQFLILTKRAARMREFTQANLPELRSKDDAWRRRNADRSFVWTPGNIGGGVSIEDQERALERVPDLLGSGFAWHFLSCEPLLGPIDLTRFLQCCGKPQPTGVTDGPIGCFVEKACCGAPYMPLDYVIVGGESGSKAREMQADWAKLIVNDCDEYDVTVHFKQWGEFRDGVRVGKRSAGALIGGALRQPLPVLPSRAKVPQIDLFGGMS